MLMTTSTFVTVLAWFGVFLFINFCMLYLVYTKLQVKPPKHVPYVPKTPRESGRLVTTPSGVFSVEEKRKPKAITEEEIALRELES